MSKVSTLTSVKIAQWGHDHLMYLPLYVAIHSGKTKQLKLDVTLINTGNDDRTFQQVATGKTDFGFGDPVFVEIGKRQGIKASCVALIVKRAAIWGITHNPAIPMLKKPEDFVQLRIGSFPKPSTVYTLLSGLKQKHKRLLKNTSIVEAAIGKQASLLTNNKADVVMELEPMVSLAEANGLHTVLSIAEFYDDTAFTGLMVLDKTIQDKPLVVDKMIQALQYGLDVCLNDLAKALLVAEKVFPDYPPAILEKGIKRLRSHGVWPKTTNVDPTAWQKAVALRKKIGDL